MSVRGYHQDICSSAEWVIKVVVGMDWVFECAFQRSIWFFVIVPFTSSYSHHVCDHICVEVDIPKPFDFWEFVVLILSFSFSDFNLSEVLRSNQRVDFFVRGVFVSSGSERVCIWLERDFGKDSWWQFECLLGSSS